MDILSSKQLEEYGHILDEINSEFEKGEALKKEIEKENDKIIVARLASKKFGDQLSHVNVKIFDDLIELCSLYQKELYSYNLHKLFKYKNCKFYLLEIYITQILLQKIIDGNWLLNISLHSDKICINETVALNNQVPIYEILPVDDSVYDSIIDCKLVLPSTTEEWLIINLVSVSTDVSFHFHNVKDKTHFENRNSNLLKLIKTYNENIQLTTFKPITLEYQIPCYNKKQFVQSFIKNCYHKLNIELFSELNIDESESSVNIQFSIGTDKHLVKYNEQFHSMKLKSNVHFIYKILEYFLMEFVSSKQSADCNEILMQLKAVISKLAMAQDVPEVQSVYKNIRKLVEKL